MLIAEVKIKIVNLFNEPNPQIYFNWSGIRCCGGSLYLFFSFKYDTAFTFVSYGSLLAGWGFITYPVLGNNVLKIKNSTTLKTILVVLFLGSIWLFSNLADDRLAYIFQHDPVKTTTATVLTTWTEGSFHGESGYATLKYYTTTRIIQKEISNSNGRYRAGRSFLIKYLVEDPKIFQVIKEAGI